MELLLWIVISIIGVIIGYIGFQWGKGVFYEGLENNNKIDGAVKRDIEFLHHLITHSDPTPDNSGDYTSDIGIELINQYIKTLPTEHRLHPSLTPYMDKLQHTIDTDENDKLILELKQLIVDIHDKQQARLNTKNLAEISKQVIEEADDGVEADQEESDA